MSMGHSFGWAKGATCSLRLVVGVRPHAAVTVAFLTGVAFCLKNADRFEMQPCNTQECVGDEICIAMQDPVIALDGSGSMKQDGLVKVFALNLTCKYQSAYYGMEDLRIGLVSFGNGHYFDHGTVSAAIEMVSFTSDLTSV